MARKKRLTSISNVLEPDTFELSWFTESGAVRGIKLYEGLGYRKLGHRKDGTKTWVTFSCPTEHDPRKK